MNIPCSTCKQINGQFCSVKDIRIKQLNMEYAHAVMALYPNHAASTDNSNLVLVVEHEDTFSS